MIVYGVYMVLGMGLPQRLVIWPLLTLLPSRYRAIMRVWLRLQARITLRLARSLANVRITVRGAIGPESCIVIMNHQSVLDIPLGVSLVPGPYPYIPYRTMYRKGIPGISPLVRLTRSPAVTQSRKGATPAELEAIARAAADVSRGDQSIIIFPEGHRSRTGEIARFMKRGLHIILSRAKRPVYCVVVDGLWHVRTFADAAFRFANTSVRVTVLGPFPAPADADIENFLEDIHRRMSVALDEMQTADAAGTELA